MGSGSAEAADREMRRLLIAGQFGIDAVGAAIAGDFFAGSIEYLNFGAKDALTLDGSGTRGDFRPAGLTNYRTRSSNHGSNWSMGMRCCSIESRSRTVTVFLSSSPFSPRVSKSTVTQNGVPISSWRR